MMSGLTSGGRVVGAMLFGALCVTAVADEGAEFFEKRIRPLLVERCLDCHGGPSGKVKGGLRLDSRAALLQGGDSGPAMIPGNPADSRLIEAVGYGNSDLQMPPKGRLADREIEDLTAWIQQGAPWPEEARATGASEEEGFNLDQRRRDHWAWQPIRPVPPPEVKFPSWVRQPPDAFILARLEAEGLSPTGPAKPEGLVRRVYFDLIGLPPSPNEVDAFASDPSAAAWEQLVDRLLASPRFGERWARHWLDLVRYSETLGHEFDYALPNAWRYRDYVIRALNADVPYDQFAREHLAGDLLDPPRRHPTEGFNESIIGTAFYWFGQRPHSPVDVKQHQAEVIDDQIDVLSKTFLGLTVACARCHDHKFDALSARDYYALYGILGSSRYAQRAIDPPAPDESQSRLRAALREALHPLANQASSSTDSVMPADLKSRSDDVEFADFGSRGFEGWFTEGDAFGDQPAEAGEIIPLSTNRVAILNRPAAHSARFSRKHQGILASPTFVIEKRYLHVLAAGRASRIRVPVENFTMIRDPIYGGLRRTLDHDEFRWITIDAGMWRGRRAFLEWVDVPTPDLAADSPQDGASPDAYAAVSRVIFSDHAEPPSSIPEASVARVIEVDPGSAAGGALAQFFRAEAASKEPDRVPAMMEGSGLDEVVFIRGNPRNPGEVVPRRFLEALSSDAAAFDGPESGRLELARQIARADSPLFARVIVNRVWLHLFGRGLVSTPDDFGVLGQAPSHPELLDWLAHWFRTEGEWSIKRLIRLLATSNSYRLSSRPTEALAEERDPSNRLWHRMPVRRLEGEAIRDAILAVSGRLEVTPFGPSVPVHLTGFMDGRGRPGQSGPADGAGRRSIYLEVRRNFLPPLMRAFDTPVPFTTVGRRTVSNVPAQSLILMNDPMIQAEAERWARQAIADGSTSTAARLEGLYRTAFGRSPDGAEVASAAAFLEAQGRRYQDTDGAAPDDLRVWADLCHVLFNVKEFIYLH